VSYTTQLLGHYVKDLRTLVKDCPTSEPNLHLTKEMDSYSSHTHLSHVLTLGSSLLHIPNLQPKPTAKIPKVFNPPLLLHQNLYGAVLILFIRCPTKRLNISYVFRSRYTPYFRKSIQLGTGSCSSACVLRVEF
jgi:hypothetical protein